MKKSIVPAVVCLLGAVCLMSGCRNVWLFVDDGRPVPDPLQVELAERDVAALERIASALERIAEKEPLSIQPAAPEPPFYLPGPVIKMPGGFHWYVTNLPAIGTNNIILCRSATEARHYHHELGAADD